MEWKGKCEVGCVELGVFFVSTGPSFNDVRGWAEMVACVRAHCTLSMTFFERIIRGHGIESRCSDWKKKPIDDCEYSYVMLSPWNSFRHE